MRNQRQINVEKFNRMWWKYEGGTLTARQEISRDPFGKFRIIFRQCIESGKVGMRVVCDEFYLLTRQETEHESFEEAVSAVAAYFDEIDEYAKKVGQNVREEARRASNRIIAAEIKKYATEVLEK